MLADADGTATGKPTTEGDDGCGEGLVLDWESGPVEAKMWKRSIMTLYQSSPVVAIRVCWVSDNPWIEQKITLESDLGLKEESV